MFRTYMSAQILIALLDFPLRCGHVDRMQSSDYVVIAGAMCD